MHRKAAAAAAIYGIAIWLCHIALPYMDLPYMALTDIDSEKKSEIFQKKVIAFHQSGLEWRTWFDFERSRTAATRSTTYKGSKKFKMLFLKKTMSKTLNGILEKSDKIVDFAWMRLSEELFEVWRVELMQFFMANFVMIVVSGQTLLKN